MSTTSYYNTRSWEQGQRIFINSIIGGSLSVCCISLLSLQNWTNDNSSGIINFALFYIALFTAIAFLLLSTLASLFGALRTITPTDNYKIKFSELVIGSFFLSPFFWSTYAIFCPVVIFCILHLKG
jgi:hypothetical protein